MYNIIYKSDIMQAVLNSVMTKKELAYNVYLFYGENLDEMDCNETNYSLRVVLNCVPKSKRRLKMHMSSTKITSAKDYHWC